jgi:hypothetical protein
MAFFIVTAVKTSNPTTGNKFRRRICKDYTSLRQALGLFKKLKT